MDFFNRTYVVGSKSFRPDIQNLRQMENAVRANKENKGFEMAPLK